MLCLIMFARAIQIQDIVPAIIDGVVPPVGKPEEYKEFESLHQQLIVALKYNGSKYAWEKTLKEQANFLYYSKARKRQREDEPHAESADADSDTGDISVCELKDRSQDNLVRHAKQ